MKPVSLVHHLCLIIAASLLLIPTVQANQTAPLPLAASTKLRDLKQPAKTVKEWLAQSETTPSSAAVKVTGVKLDRAENGLDITLETSESKPLQVDATKFRAEGKSLIADIPNAVLALPGTTEFTAENPTSEIATVRVIQTDASTIRVDVMGTAALPKSDVTLKVGGLAYSLNPEGQTPEEEVVVTGAGRTPYRVPNSSTATGTNTRIIDTPAAIQVIPQDIIRDQQVIQLKDALSNISGVTYGGDIQGRSGNTFSIRGFTDAPVLRDGFRRFGSSGEGGSQPAIEVANLEQIEVLKGPASILYGAIEPGGLINLVSKKPLANPFYEAELQVGSRGLVRPRFDFSGPLNTDGTVLYRLNGLYQRFDSVRNLDQEDRRFFIAPTLAWKINDRTDLNVSLEYIDNKRPADFGLPAVGNGVPNVPRDRIIGEPSDVVTSQSLDVGYTFEHRFNQNWKFRNAFRYSSYDYDFGVIPLPLFFDETTSTVNRFLASQDAQSQNYTVQANLVGEFATGSIKHTLLAGVDYVHKDSRIFSRVDFVPRPLNLFNPVYGLVKPDENALPPFGGSETNANSWGFYLQDQLALLPNLKLLAGIRYDTLRQTTVNLPGLATEPGESTQNDDAFTPRIGLLYQPTPTIALYGSYSRSFTPNTATNATGEILGPQRGKGYEFGIKTDWLNGKLFATLAYFDVTKQNVAVPDPNFPLASIASGEQRSRGVEFDVSGELLPGWKLIASYAYIDAKVTADTDATQVGNRLYGVPKNSASLWTTYEIQRGNLQGLGFGVGFNYVGERQGDLANSFVVDGYVTTNAAISYKRANWRLALNFKNIGDVKYIESVFNSRGAANYFGDPFTVIGSISVQF
ncbi:MAG: TonB-dependent siderophore receptor [Lyngbya sp. HA4199-MV5]|nr:TonB-dependent siderophore receptor [Lyngbya sp. HA4199-MV5]